MRMMMDGKIVRKSNADVMDAQKRRLTFIAKFQLFVRQSVLCTQLCCIT